LLRESLKAEHKNSTYVDRILQKIDEGHEDVFFNILPNLHRISLLEFNDAQNLLLDEIERLILSYSDK
jgi:hypothetical protein